jgi:hypothetical protein
LTSHIYENPGLRLVCAKYHVVTLCIYDAFNGSQGTEIKCYIDGLAQRLKYSGVELEARLEQMHADSRALWVGHIDSGIAWFALNGILQNFIESVRLDDSDYCITQPNIHLLLTFPAFRLEPTHC